MTHIHRQLSTKPRMPIKTTELLLMRHTDFITALRACAISGSSHGQTITMETNPKRWAC